MKIEHLSRYGVVRQPAPAPPAGGAGSSTLLDRPRRHTAGVSDDASATVVSTVHSVEHRHGLHALRDLRHVTGSNLSLICRDLELAYFDVGRAVFLDTETTGLGMGAGTYVFLVGAGYVDNGAFHVKQFFLRGPQEEHIFLDQLAAFLGGFSAIVTFNGKAFDWPLLENRYIMHRREPPLQDPLHVDLLHSARRLWKRRLESCALSSLEARVLEVIRTEQDVPGYLIPQLYFQYQSSGDRGLLERVFYHNLQDVLSLATLTVHIDTLIASPHSGMVQDGVDYLCLAKAFELAGEIELALDCYEEALRRLAAGPDRVECLIALAAMQKRDRRWDALAHTWHQLLDEGGSGALFARVELAKYHEHVEKDYMQAIDQVQHALLLADFHDSTWPGTSRQDLEHRLSRLVNRAIRSRSWVGAT